VQRFAAIQTIATNLTINAFVVPNIRDLRYTMQSALMARQNPAFTH
jgi:hypothetical protein